MMKTRLNGTERPKKDAGGLRHGLLVLAVLLLTCVLMAGAVSAETTTENEFNQSNFTTNDKPAGITIYNITTGGTYILNQSVNGNISITAPNSNIILTSKNNAALTGLIVIHAAKSVTIENMKIILTNDLSWAPWSNSGHAHRIPAVSYDGYGQPIKIIMKNNVIDSSAVSGSASNSKLRDSNMFKSHGPELLDGSEFSGNTVINTTGNVINLVGIENDSTLIVKDNIVSMNPIEDNNYALVKSYDNDKTPVSNITYIIENNSVKVQGINQSKIMKIDQTATGYKSVTVTLTANTYNEDMMSVNVYGGDLSSADIGTFHVKQDEDTVLLIPNLAQTDVTWDGNEVTVAKAGRYVLDQEKYQLSAASVDGVILISLNPDPEPQPPQPTPVPPSGGSSGDGNMDNAYRVLFNDGSTTLSVVTDLSSGDKLTKPETPVKDGYTFAGWYKDSACTQGWDFETGIPGDMTLYAKWTAAGSSGEAEATATPTATAVTTPQPTKTQSTTATTSAPEATTAAGVSPTLTQAPAPVAGALFGLLAAGVLLRRRFQ